MKICAVVPSYNHATVIGAIVARLHTAGLPVFVIDDGSNAPAAAAIAALHNPDARVWVHRLPVNRGKGVAVTTGFRLAWEAGFTHAVQVDADGQHELDTLPALLEAARQDPDALVSGQPVYDASIPTGRKIGRWVTHFWVWIETWSFQISDSMCGFRAYPLASVRALLAREPVGRRMDFDTDIMVRLFWAGVPVRMVPVKVVYPPDNTSNFDLVRDNVRISWMHTRLVVTGLWRWLTRTHRASASHHWAALTERGALWGIEFLEWAYRRLGRRACLTLMRPVVLFFFLTGGEQRRASLDYLTRVHGRPVLWRDGFRHCMDFTTRTLDSFIGWTGGIQPAAIVPDDPIGLAHMAADPRGALFVVAHFGNSDLARATMDAATRARLTILVHSRHAENIAALLRRLRPDAAQRMVQVTELGPERAIDLRQRVERGEWVVIAGDRTPVLSHGHVSRIPFLGKPAAFPHGPWILASLLGCPVYLLFCVRDEDIWRLTIEPFADQVKLPRPSRQATLEDYCQRYAARLEHHVRAHPVQWYNFYDFWAE